ncbi:hypothetical protein PFFVO_01842 [Plasmodium falciparum Vietnam Oak-Knoll (FVO)]|uniref:Uncharacterized protein n=1 Tax=Plasmodium falciparum Vietnam Oak-Knoll (FVO) TaxID=1036723 RepID=A0A024V9Y8_PLAFA|nr:hypothetical protein PFFVO_01842 [Plasmodium falciparum Vietnam Oak-Knoll (FVO)]
MYIEMVCKTYTLIEIDPIFKVLIIKGYFTITLKKSIKLLDTPEPWGDSETYEVVTKDKHGNLITTVFNKNAEALYFYINKKKPKEKNSSKPKNSKMRKKGQNN